MKSERESDLKTLTENSKQEKAKSSQVTSCDAHLVQINILHISVLGTWASLRGQGD